MRIETIRTSTEHERVEECFDDAVGYHAIIAIHSTKLGPAVGGSRFWPYQSREEALADVLRLSRGMTYKSALADLPLGGGKSVIVGDNRLLARQDLFRAHGRFIARFEGSFFTAEDVGTSPSDMSYIRLETPYVAGLLDKSGDPSPCTAQGVVRAMQAAVAYRLKSPDLKGCTVSIQGCGNVGRNLALQLHEAGAKLVISDVDPKRVEAVVQETGAAHVAPDDIFSARADIFAPCALGAILNDDTIARLNVSIVCGAANNQLQKERHGEFLYRRRIHYVPDYVANAGGLINGCQELCDWPREVALSRIENIYHTALAVFHMAEAHGIPPSTAADRMARTRLDGSGQQ